MFFSDRKSKRQSGVSPCTHPKDSTVTPLKIIVDSTQHTRCNIRFSAARNRRNERLKNFSACVHQGHILNTTPHNGYVLFKATAVRKTYLLFTPYTHYTQRPVQDSHTCIVMTQKGCRAYGYCVYVWVCSVCVCVGY